MKGKLIVITVLFAVLIIAITANFYISDMLLNQQDLQSDYVVKTNEIEQLARLGKSELAAEKASELQQSIRSMGNRDKNDNRTLIMCVVSLIFLLSVLGYIYCAILRPFDKMKYFAQRISHGDFDIPLNYERSNYFGEFTWAFDNMRREITKARLCEKEAIENNKTIIATLSHDIKTPISSIRAYAEGLGANLDTNVEKRTKYLSVLMKKCDEVSNLTNDLFLHSLSDLDKLKINLESIELCEFLESAIDEISADQNDIHFIKPNFKVTVSADKNRFTQITENLINNARKYAKSDIDVSILQSDGNVEIHFRDYGTGIPDEDMPFIFGKFYRGKNSGNEQGSGLGLYIVKYIAEKMGGKVLLHNHNNGLEAIVILPEI